MPVTGIGKLRELAASLRSLASDSKEIERKLTEHAADETRKAIASGKSPDGKRWVKGGSGLRRMASYVAVSGSRIVVRHRWAGVHHKGGTMTGTMRFRAGGKWRSAKNVTVPARPLLPSSMPVGWARAMKPTLIAAVRRKLRI